MAFSGCPSGTTIKSGPLPDLPASSVPAGRHRRRTLADLSGNGDLVADSLADTIQPWNKSPYQWVRIQSPKTPTFWSAVGKLQA